MVVPAPGFTAKRWVRVFIFLLPSASGMRLSVASLLEAFIDGSYYVERAQPTQSLLVPLVLVFSFLRRSSNTETKKHDVGSTKLWFPSCLKQKHVCMGGAGLVFSFFVIHQVFWNLCGLKSTSSDEGVS